MNLHCLKEDTPATRLIFLHLLLSLDLSLYSHVPCSPSLGDSMSHHRESPTGRLLSSASPGTVVAARTQTDPLLTFRWVRSGLRLLMEVSLAPDPPLPPHCTKWGISQNRPRGLSLPGCTYPHRDPLLPSPSWRRGYLRAHSLGLMSAGLGRCGEERSLLNTHLVCPP